MASLYIREGEVDTERVEYSDSLLEKASAVSN